MQEPERNRCLLEMSLIARPFFFPVGHTIYTRVLQLSCVLKNMTKENEIPREQTRGLYIVGLLAVLITIKLTIKISDSLTDSFLLYLISSWATYSFCMIFAFSDMPRMLVSFFKELAWIFLWLSLIVSIAYFAILSYLIFTMGFPLIIVFYMLFGIAIIVIHQNRKSSTPKS